MGPRQRRWMAASVLDAGEVRRRCGRIIEKPQRDPTRHKMALDAGVFLGRLGSVSHHQIRGPGIADIEQIARHHPALHPPSLRIMDLGKLAGGGQHHLRGFGNLALAGTASSSFLALSPLRLSAIRACAIAASGPPSRRAARVAVSLSAANSRFSMRAL